MRIIEIERLVIVVDLGQVRVGEDLCEYSPFRSHLRLQLTALGAFPAAIPAFLVFPFARIAHAWLGFDVVEPRVFNAFAIGPDVLAGDRTGVAPDALVEIEHHADLGADLHRPASVCASGSSSQSTLVILRM